MLEEESVIDVTGYRSAFDLLG